MPLPPSVYSHANVLVDEAHGTPDPSEQVNAPAHDTVPDMVMVVADDVHVRPE
jgi:hypothetical protein